MSSASQKEQQKTDEVDHKTESESAETVDVNESNADDKEESTECSSDAVRAPTPEVVTEENSTEIKTDPPDDKTETPSSIAPIKSSSSSDSDDNLIDVEDSDDYLLYLETILKTIHSRFYSYYEDHEKVFRFGVTLLLTH